MTEQNGVERTKTELTATERLRKMLDEMGIEHEDTDITIGDTAYGHTTIWDKETISARFSEKSGRGTLLEAWDLTPEQAIAATVGERTCELINAADDLGKGTSSCMCFGCGYTALDEWWDEFKFCPNCGARIEVGE